MASSALPVAAFRGTILSTVAANAVTVITAETGAGKSTQVPVYLAEAGYRVIVTQPRRLAARSVAERVAEEMRVSLGGRVGYATAEERRASAETQVLFCTDGLQLVRELSGHGKTGGKTVLVLDEVHEWNTNMEVLVAWARQRVEAGEELKVVLMSATLDAEGLSAFFGGAPIITVPGRLFPVTKSQARADALVDKVVELAGAGRNVLVFQPGKREIEECSSAIERKLGGKAVVLPLHGGLEPGEQKRCFAPAGKAKVVVSTNVAQTSVTIPDIDAVVDSGMERRIELRDGIEGLYLLPTSQADCAQRAGRAGRVKEGVYVLCSETSEASRPAFPTAEFLRTRLDQTVLRLAVQGFDASALKFFHQPDVSEIDRARKSLVALGAMTASAEVTRVGRRMARLPVSVQFARMLIEAERLGVVEEVATIAACLEAGEIRARTGEWKSLTAERRSDLLALLDVYNAGQNAIRSGGGSRVEVLKQKGIFAKDFFRAGELRGKLIAATRDEMNPGARPQGVEAVRGAILKAGVAGMVDHLYSRSGYGYRNGDAGERELARESVLAGSSPAWIVGLPFDVNGTNARGRSFTLRLVTTASTVDTALLAEVAPHLSEEKTGLRPTFDAVKDCVVSTTEMFFNGQKTGEKVVEDGEHPEATRVFVRWLAGLASLPVAPSHSAGQNLDAAVRANAARQARAKELNVRSGEETFKVYSTEEMVEHYVAALAGARRVIEVVQSEAVKLPTLDEAKVAEVVHNTPDAIEVLGSELAVEYRPTDWYGRNFPPRVKLTSEMVKAHAWINLPDEGIRLPSGRLVEIVIPVSYWDTIEGTDLVDLKLRGASRVNQSQWDSWSDRPAIVLPDLQTMEAMPEIVEVSYGTSVIDGSPLIAYGTVSLKGYRYYPSDPWFEGKWCRSLKEATELHGSAAAKFEELHKEVLEQKRLAEAEAEAERARIEAERIEAGALAVILEALGEGATLSEARDVKSFAEEAERIAGGARPAAGKLGNELNAPYGRARRQDAVVRQFPGIEHSETGARFLGFGRASDVDAWLAGALAWLRAKSAPAKSGASVPVTAAAPKAEPDKLDLTGLFGGVVVIRKK